MQQSFYLSFSAHLFFAENSYKFFITFKFTNKNSPDIQENLNQTETIEKFEIFCASWGKSKENFVCKLGTYISFFQKK